MEEDNQCQEEQVVDEQPESDTTSGGSNVSFGIKDAVIMIVAFLVVFVLFVKIVLPALVPTHHSTTKFIKELNVQE